MEENDKKDLIFSKLTSREQEVLDLLLAGSIPKEIATVLYISYATVLDHQKNLYRKLDVHNINELLVKFPKQQNTNIIKAADSLNPVFSRLDTFSDHEGSNIAYTLDNEKIGSQEFKTYTIHGYLNDRLNSFSHITLTPDPNTFAFMKEKMIGFSFSFKGDGNTYGVALTTSDSKNEGENNHYPKLFTAEKDKMLSIKLDLFGLTQYSTWGKQVPFIRENIIDFTIYTYSQGDFNLKFWDIKFY